MTTDIVSEGRLVSTTHIERGETLVHPEWVWRARSRPYRRRSELVSLAVSIGFVGPPLVILIAILVFIPNHGGILVLVLFFGGLTLCMVIISVIAHVSNRKEIAETPPEGLYERGVQLFHLIFVPYGEIASVSEREVKGSPFLELHLHGHEDESIRERNPKVWRIPEEFLGEEGVKELEARVHAPGSPS